MAVSFWFDPPPPSSTFREYVISQKSRSTAPRASAQNAFAERFSRVAGPDAFKAVEQGLAVGGVAATIGAAAGAPIAGIGGVIGGIAGAVGGFIGGVTAGLVPTARNEAEGQWDRIVTALSPLERYALFPTMRNVAANNLRAQQLVLPGGSPQDPGGPWRWADDPPFGHSPWGGPVGRTVNLLERLFRVRCIPQLGAGDSQEDRDTLSLYVVLFCAGAHDDGKRPSDMRAVWPLLANGQTAPELVREFGQWANRSLGDLRNTIAPQRRIRTIWNPVLTPSMRAAYARAGRR